MSELRDAALELLAQEWPDDSRRKLWQALSDAVKDVPPAMAATRVYDELDSDGRRAPFDVKRLCWKIAEQAGKGNYWNAIHYAAEVIIACQKAHRAEQMSASPEGSEAK